MEPFHVTCETCHARLKIRSESVIGQIHSCPKCESMVHIVPPLGWVPSTESPVEATGQTPSDASAAATSSTLLMWSLGAAALALAVGAITWMWPRGEESPTVALAPPLAAVAAESKVEPPADSPVIELLTDGPPIAPATDDALQEPVAEVPQSESPEVEPAQVQVVAQAPALPGVSVEEITTTPTESKPQEAANSPAAATDGTSKKPVMKFDPLDFDPSQLSLGGATGNKASETSAAVAGAGAEPVAVDRRNDGPADPQQAGPPEGDPSITVRLGPGATDVLRPRKVAEQLAIKVESLDLAAAPLTRFVGIVSDLSSVPVTIDPAALAMAGVSPQATVDVQARNTTIDKLLHDVLAKLRLDVGTRDGHVIVTHPSRDVRRNIDYDVKDLLEPGATDATALAERIQRLVAPASWRGGENGGTILANGSKLRVEHTHDVQIQVLMFCERLRLARGLPPRSRYPAAQLSIDPAYEKLSAKLSKPTTFTFLPWTRLADVLRHWQESIGVTILVDWPALAQEELAPATPIACSAINRPWDTAIDAMLEPLGLAWRPIDGETIQITSRAALVQMERIEFYTAPKGEAGVDIKAEGVAHAEFDAPSGRLIVLASPDVHRALSVKSGNSSPQRHDDHDVNKVNATPLGSP